MTADKFLDEQRENLKRLRTEAKFRIKLNNSLKSLENLISEKPNTQDFYRHIVDLFNAPEDVQLSIFKLENNLNTYIDKVVTFTKAYKELNSPEKVKQFILEELLECRDPYDLICPKTQMPGAAMNTIYDRLIEINKLREIFPDKISPFRKTLEVWDEAALEIVLNKEMYFTKTRIGNEGTISEFVGRMVLANIPFSSSPLVEERKYFDRIFDSIKYEEIINGNITDNESREVEHQVQLLRLLHRTQKQNNRLPKSYWQEIQKNIAFLGFSYEIALTNKDPQADELLLLLLKKEYKESNEDLEKFKRSARHILWEHFSYLTKQTAYSKFLEDPINEYKRTLNGNLSITGIRNPKEFAYLSGPRVIVMTGYKRSGEKARVWYIELDDGFERKSTALNLKTRSYSEISKEVGESLLSLVDDFERFKSEYKSYLNTVKTKHKTETKTL